jgi:hypothetical protein
MGMGNSVGDATLPECSCLERPVEVGLSTVFEFELFGTGADPGHTTFCLRHAYGQLGAFRSRTNLEPFMDINVFPNKS